MSERPPSNVEYERGAPGGGITARQGRWLIILMFVNTLLLTISVGGVQLTPWISGQLKDWSARRAEAQRQAQVAAQKLQQQQRFLALQAAAMNHAFPRGWVSYESDPQRAAAALLSGKDYTRAFAQIPDGVSRAGWQLPVLAPITGPAALIGFPIDHGREAILFLHERRTPQGESKLVLASLGASVRATQAQYGSNAEMLAETDLRIIVRLFNPIQPGQDRLTFSDRPADRQHALELKLPKSLYTRFRFHNGNTGETPEIRLGVPVRFLAGESDAGDATHFTLPYVVGDSPGVVDVSLHNDAIQIHPREGEPGANATWMLPALSATTKPS